MSSVKRTNDGVEDEGPVAQRARVEEAGGLVGVLEAIGPAAESAAQEAGLGFEGSGNEEEDDGTVAPGVVVVFEGGPLAAVAAVDGVGGGAPVEEAAVVAPEDVANAAPAAAEGVPVAAAGDGNSEATLDLPRESPDRFDRVVARAERTARRLKVAMDSLSAVVDLLVTPIRRGRWHRHELQSVPDRAEVAKRELLMAYQELAKEYPRDTDLAFDAGAPDGAAT